MIDKDLLKNLTTEQKQALLDQLMGSLSQSTAEEPEETEQDLPANNINENFRVTKTKTQLERGRTPVRARKNRWEDTGEFQLEGEEEWSNDRKRSSRSRAKAKKVQLECSVCGKTYMESPSLVYGEYHRCNRCGGR
jgi:formylmethanofuran dehydrogenase subunit E